MENNTPQTPILYTEEQLMARLKFFIGICLALTLTGIVFVVLYSLIFVTQPLNAISPIDQKFFELIVPIATFLTGTLSGIMLAGGDKDAQKMALQAATRPTPVSPRHLVPQQEDLVMRLEALHHQYNRLAEQHLARLRQQALAQHKQALEQIQALEQRQQVSHPHPPASTQSVR